MMLSLLRIAFLLFYLILVSQGIFYLLAAGKAFSVISVPAFAEQRIAIDSVISARLKFTYISLFFLGLSILLLTFKNMRSMVFVSTAVAFLFLLTDFILAIKYNIPINKLFSTYSIQDKTQDWNNLRLQWLLYMGYRGVIQTLGFLFLLSGMCFSQLPGFNKTIEMN